MYGEKKKIRAGMSAQTSMESTTATIDGHGEEQSSPPGVGHLSGNATATSQAKLSRTGAVVEADVGSESVIHEAETSHSRLPEPGSNSPRKEGPKSTRDGMKAKANSKPSRTGAGSRTKRPSPRRRSKSREEKEGQSKRLRKEEMLANIIQRSHESAAKEISVSKRKRGPKEAGPPPPKVAKSLSATTI